MFKLAPLFVVFSLSLSTNMVQLISPDALNIAVYYESLCPDSRRFINNGLSQALVDYKDIVNIILVPFGNANVNTSLNLNSFSRKKLNKQRK